MTTYSYDALSNLKGVNQSGQIRSYLYDGLGRMLTETNPETSQSGTGGTSSYTYDSVSDGKCAVSSAGDKVERIDPAGNYSCYQWDGLHRLTEVSYPSGPNTSNMPSKYFFYDLATPWGISVNNPLGRLTLAYTYGSGITYNGEVFSYDARGEVTDFYESTQHSGWYRVQQAYFPNGVLMSAQGFNGTGTSVPFSDLFSYSVDGKGRPYGMVDSGTTVWGSTTYNAADQPLTVNAGGTEVFTYDPNSGRMTTWTSTPTNNGQQAGTLTWNLNGTLQKLQIADTTGSGSGQTCGYTYDDLARLASVNCTASIWQQNFAYDMFGNITKTVPPGATGYSFNPTSYSGNHANILSYDLMGNVTQDNLSNQYSYDAEGRPVTAAGVQINFDAFGRAVEENSGGTYTQIVYSPTGGKFAFMNGSSLKWHINPMVAGMARVQNADGSSFLQHADELGSSWLGVHGYDGSIAYDRAYAPFGETYGESSSANRNFTGQTQDTVSGIYDFLFRQYSPSQGRWQVPDPAGMAAVDMTNPQTWNRYAYVANNPLSFIDPLGLIDCLVNPDGSPMNGGCGGDYGAMGTWGDSSFPQWVDPTNTETAITDPNNPTMQTFTISHTLGYWQVSIGSQGGVWFSPGGRYGGNSIIVNPNPRPPQSPNPPDSQYRCEQGQILGGLAAGAAEAVGGASSDVKQLIFNVAQNPGVKAMAGSVVAQVLVSYFAVEAGTAAGIAGATSDVAIPLVAGGYAVWRGYQGVKAYQAYAEQHPCQ